MPQLPIKHVGIPADRFPFLIRALSPDGSVVWAEWCTGAGTPYVPPLSAIYGMPITIEVSWPDGTVLRRKPPPEAIARYASDPK